MKPKAKPRSKTVKAAPVRWSQAIADLICERLKGGESLNAICKDKDLPTENAVREWVHDDKHGFAANYSRAREIGYSRLAEEILNICDTPLIGTKTTSKATGVETTEGDMIEHRRLQVDTRKWMLSKMLPKIYGDKQQVELSGTVDIASTLMSARKRSGLA
jgi:hypothetical protein